MRNHFAIAAALMLLIGSPRLSKAELPVCSSLNYPYCETAAQRNARLAGEAYRRAIAEKAEFNTKIAASRQKMRQACTTNRNLRDHVYLIPETQNFLALLDAKDLYFLSLYYDPMGLGLRHNQLTLSAEKMTGPRLDGGIRPMTGLTWDDWTDSINAKAQKTQLSLDGLVHEFEIIATAKDATEYRRYRLARNIVEFNACGCNLTTDAKELWVAHLIMRQPWAVHGSKLDPEDTAAKYYESLTDVFGKQAMQGAATALLSAQKADDGAVLVGSRPTQPDRALLILLTRQSDRAYDISLLLGIESIFSISQLRDAQAQCEALEAAYGTQALREATKLAKSLQTDAFGRVVNAAASGTRGGSLKSVLLDSLANQNPEAYARAVVAFHDRLTTKQTVDSAMDILVRTYGGDAVSKCSSDLVKLWNARSDTLPEPFARMQADRLNKYGSDPGKDFDLLAAVLKKTEMLPSLDNAAVTLSANPEYLAWAKFQPGANAVYAFETTVYRNGAVDPQSNRSSGGPYGGIIEVHLLKAIDAENATVEIFDKVMAHARDAEPHDMVYPAKLGKYARPDDSQNRALVSRSSGTDTLVVNGREYTCTYQKTVYRFPQQYGPHAYSAKIVTVWRSEAVPGGVVLEREQTGDSNQLAVNEKVLQPFSISSPAVLTGAQPVTFDVKSSSIPEYTTEAASVANSGPVQNIQTTDGKPPVVPAGSLIRAATRESLTVAQIGDGISIEYAITEPIRANGAILYPNGTRIQFRVQVADENRVVFTAEGLLINGQLAPLRSTNAYVYLKNPDTGAPKTAPSPSSRQSISQRLSLPRGPLGRVTGSTVNLPRGTDSNSQSRTIPSGRFVPANSAIVLLSKDSGQESSVDSAPARGKKHQ